MNMALKLENAIKRSCFPLGNRTLMGMRLILQILLLAIFFQFFGLPAIEKYHKKDVMIVKTVKDTEGNPLPAISLMFTDLIFVIFLH